MIRELREQPPDLVRLGVGADVEVLWFAAHHQVAHAAAHQVGQVAGVVQAVEDLEGVLVDVPAGDRVLGASQRCVAPLRRSRSRGAHSRVEYKGRGLSSLNGYILRHEGFRALGRRPRIQVRLYRGTTREASGGEKSGPRRAEGIKTRPGTGGRGDCLAMLAAAALSAPRRLLLGSKIRRFRPSSHPPRLPAIHGFHGSCQGSGRSGDSLFPRVCPRLRILGRMVGQTRVPCG